MAHVHGIDDVVEHLHEHADDGRNGELEQQLERALDTHAVDLVVIRTSPDLILGRRAQRLPFFLHDRAYRSRSAIRARTAMPYRSGAPCRAIAEFPGLSRRTRPIGGTFQESELDAVGIRVIPNLDSIREPPPESKAGDGSQRRRHYAIGGVPSALPKMASICTRASFGRDETPTTRRAGVPTKYFAYTSSRASMSSRSRR